MVAFSRTDSVQNKMIIVSSQIRVHEDERDKILKRSEVEREAADDEQHRAETYLVRKNISNWLPFLKNGPFPASFFVIFVFSIQLTVNKCLLTEFLLRTYGI